jgi:type IV fimbrial biogenesis protein FimT
MRQLNRRSKGFTLIELMITLAVMAILGLAALPDLTAYLANSQLREGANGVVVAAQMARNEALKLNTTVTLSASGQTLTLSGVVGGANTTLRTTQLPGKVQLSAFTAAFNSSGLLTPFGTTVTITTSLANKTCTEDMRCPAVRIEAGGTASVCPTGVCS